jgi:pimeloyl-ACP methyl ester carboxylesterase
LKIDCDDRKKKNMKKLEHQHEFNEPTIVQAEKSSFWKLLTWSFASMQLLRLAEKEILSYVKWPLRCFYVDLGTCVGRDDKIWTLHAPNETSNKTPLLLVHGMGAGVAHWVMSLEELAKNRPVYAIDVLGFARSSRPKFAKDAMAVEKQMVKSIEEWRRKMNLPKVILVGHSMGGYLSASYAIDYPERVQHLILADAWGLPEYSTRKITRPIPWWVKVIIFIIRPLNPLFGVRFVGPWGQKVN